MDVNGRTDSVCLHCRPTLQQRQDSSTAGRYYSRDRAPTLPSLSPLPADITAETGLLHCRVCLHCRPVLQQRQGSYTAESVSATRRYYSRDRTPTLPSLSQLPAGITAETGLLHCRVCLHCRPVLQQKQESYTADITLCDRVTHDLASILRRSVIGCRRFLPVIGPAPPPPASSVDRPRSLPASPKAHNCIISGRDHIKQSQANHRRTLGTAHFYRAGSN